MNIINVIFNFVLITWYIFYIFYIIYLTINSNGVYEVDQALDVTNINRSTEDLSLIIYRKIKPEVLTSKIVKLINNGIIRIRREDNDYILTKINDENLSKSDFNIIELLFNNIGNKNEVSLSQIDNYCEKKSGCSNFLMNYEIWKKMIVVESNKNKIFEPKLEYNTVKIIQYIGFILFILNILLKINCFLGFFIIIPSIVITIYFYHISKLTKEASEEYYGWIKFRKDIKDNVDLLNNNRYLEYSIVLRCFKNIKQENKIDFIKKLDSAIQKCYSNSFFRGNRSLFK